MSKGWFIEACWTRRGSTVRERYAVAQSASEQAVATLRRILVGRRGLRFAVMGPVPAATYYRLGLTPGSVLRVAGADSQD